mgnify:CR=1 FL=1
MHLLRLLWLTGSAPVLITSVMERLRESEEKKIIKTLRFRIAFWATVWCGQCSSITDESSVSFNPGILVANPTHYIAAADSPLRNLPPSRKLL